MTIRCKNCNNNFYLFWERFKKENTIECPYCDCKIPKEYNEYVKNALGSTWELNSKIRSDHMCGSTDLFEFDIEEVHVPVEKFKFLKGE